MFTLQRAYLAISTAVVFLTFSPTASAGRCNAVNSDRIVVFDRQAQEFVPLKEISRDKFLYKLDDEVRENGGVLRFEGKFPELDDDMPAVLTVVGWSGARTARDAKEVHLRRPLNSAMTRKPGYSGMIDVERYYDRHYYGNEVAGLAGFHFRDKNGQATDRQSVRSAYLFDGVPVPRRRLARALISFRDLITPGSATAAPIAHAGPKYVLLMTELHGLGKSNCFEFRVSLRGLDVDKLVVHVVPLEEATQSTSAYRRKYSLQH
jgi:hypothetical protein